MHSTKKKIYHMKAIQILIITFATILLPSHLLATFIEKELTVFVTSDHPTFTITLHSDPQVKARWYFARSSTNNIRICNHRQMSNTSTVELHYQFHANKKFFNPEKQQAELIFVYSKPYGITLEKRRPYIKIIAGEPPLTSTSIKDCKYVISDK
jgi:hypothetical protein